MKFNSCYNSSSQISSEGSKDEVLILEQVKLDKDCKT